MTQNPKTYQARCFCGQVTLEMTGSPELMAYCHCESCRRWANNTVSAFTLWPEAHVKVLQGEHLLARFDRNSAEQGGEVLSERTWCSRCGGHVMTRHPAMGLVDVPAANIEGFEFKPEIHVNYQERVRTMSDGLPKFRDLPAPAGGSGETIADYS